MADEEAFTPPPPDPQAPGVLNLSGQGITPKRVAGLCAYLAAHAASVTSLDLSENPIGAAGAALLSEHLKSAPDAAASGDEGAAAPGLRVLNLGSAELGEEGVLQFCENAIDCPTLRQLVLDSNGPFTPVATHAVGNLLINSQSLTELSLNDLQLDDGASHVLSECVMHNTILTSLSLEINLIEQAGAASLGEMLTINSTLRRLDLGLNRMRGEGVAQVLTAAVARNTSLTHLNFSRNWIQGIDGVAGFPRNLVSRNFGVNRLNVPCAIKIAKFLAEDHCRLRLLYLGHNLIGNDGLCVLCDALLKNTTLHLLDVGENMITAAGLGFVGSMLCTNTTLRRLLLSGNAVGNAGFELLQGAFEVATGLRSLELENCGVTAFRGTQRFNNGALVVDFDPDETDNDDSDDD